MKASINGRALGVLLTAMLLPLAAWTLLTPFYQTNDDIAMRLLAEGNFVPGDEPLPYLMFINVILGKVLSFAYEVTAAVPWYDLLLGASLIAASAALVFVWSGSGRKLELIWAFLFAAFFVFPTFVSVQFSLAGMACAAAGIALIVRSERRLHLLLGMALFFWGSLIRFEGAILISIEGMALWSVASAIAAFKGDGRSERTPYRFRAVGAALLLAGLAFAANQFAYRQAPGWKNFYEYNLLRSRLGEYLAPDRITAETTDRLVKEVGWSRNDFWLFGNWFFTDPQLFSLDKVRQAERLFYDASSKPSGDWRKERMRRGLELGSAFFKETRWAFLLMGVFVLAHGTRPKLVLYFAGIALILGILIVAISLALKAPPQRIFWPMLIMAATMLTVAAQRWGRPTHRSVSVAAIVLAAYVVASTLPPLKQESEARRVAAEAAQADVEGLRRTGATMFVLHANAFPYEDFWMPLHNEKAAFDFVGLGASARTPPVQDFLTKTGRTDLPWSLCTEPGMLIIAAPYVPPVLAAFVEEHRGVKVQFEEAFHGKRFVAWKCRR